jgi:hypothetical protein
MVMKVAHGALPTKDVKNEEWSGWIIENKGAKKVLWMS